MSAEVVPIRPHFGATADEWSHFALVVGEADLLPVVSNPGATISDKSTLRGLGKTPSLYNSNRRVIGIPGWAQKQSTLTEIVAWSREPDYGICLITRRVRGLDIDIADPDLADAVAAAFCEALGIPHLPTRERQGTGKRLLAFELAGVLPKRSFKVEGGLVELLGSGQQFIAAGTHQPTGTRYEWPDGLPLAIPRITQGDFERAWAHIVELFALEPATEGGESIARNRADIEGIADPVAAYLDEQGLILGAQGEKLFVACPWKDGHTSDSGISETAWLVAGTRGFEQGHFQCMHASCQGRTDHEFLDAVDYTVSAFRDLDATGSGLHVEVSSGGQTLEGTSGQSQSQHDDSEPQQWPRLKRDKAGRIEATVGNLEKVLARPDLCELDVRYDTFRDELMVLGAEGLRPFRDADAVRLRINLEARGFKPIGRELMRDALLTHAEDNRFDSAQDWLTGLPAWDGVERVETFFPALCNTVDDPYTRACGLYFWTALAGRVLDPGCQADMVPILQSDQGYLKSSMAQALTPPGLKAYRNLNLESLDANLSRRLRGCIVGELDELRGLRTRDAEAIRSWITQREERWVKKYQESEAVFPRRCVLLATANPAELLDDETGERRWLPMHVDREIDVAAVVAVRDQLWAEARVRWSVLGIEWRDAEKLARAEHHQFKIKDGWADVIRGWLDTPIDVSGETPNQRGWVRSMDVARGALGMDVRGVTPSHEKRIGKALRALGWKSQGHRVDGVAIWCWVRVSRGEGEI